MAIQLLFCKSLLPGFVQNGIQYFWVVSNFFSKHFIKVQVVQPYNSTDTATAWKNSHFILSKRSDFHMVVKESISVDAFCMHMLTSFTR